MHVVLSTLEELNLNNFDLAIGCSGGIDSTVLIHACLQMGLKPTLIHVNYHLRGEDSNADEAFIRELGLKNGLNVIVEDCPKSLTKGTGINLQLAARNFRHNLFRNWLQENNKRRLLLAHHQDDQIETFFLQMARGAGLFGLGGMHTENAGIIRPFLTINKKDLLEFAQLNQVVWREDSSNASSDYSRNKLRNIILPELLKTHPDLVTSVTFLQSKFREKQTELKLELAEKLGVFMQQGEIDFETWQTLDETAKILVFNQLNIPIYTLLRLNELEKSSLSSAIDTNVLIRTKHGFSWHKDFPFKNIWEFKSESIGILPQTFSNSCLYLDLDHCETSPEIGFANPSDTIQKPGNRFRSNIYELMKDSGIPKQWRSTYPVLKSKNRIIWIPYIAVDSGYLATSVSTNIQKIHIKV